MLYITNEDLAYEKYMRLLEEDEATNDEEDDIVNMNSDDPAIQAYQQGLEQIKKIILTTGRKRYQKYKLDGGKDTFAMFKKNMETQLKNELEDDMREQFGAVPGKETEKDFLRQIKMGIDNLNNNITSMMGGQSGEMVDPNAQPQEDPNAQAAQGQEQPQGNADDQLVDQSPEDPNAQPQEDPNAQAAQGQEQPMQEGFSYINETIYRNRMKKLFNEYFG